MAVRIVILADTAESPDQYLGCEIDKNGMIQFAENSGISLEVAPRPSRHAFPGHEAIVLIANLATSVAAQVLGGWLYDKLKGRSAKVIVGNQEVSPDKARLTDAIETAAGETRSNKKHRRRSPKSRKRR